MSKITFRADEDLVERIEARDASKSEIMREALRAYLDGGSVERGGADSQRDARSDSAERAPADAEQRATAPNDGHGRASERAPREGRARTDTLDAFLAERVDELVTARPGDRRT